MSSSKNPSGRLLREQPNPLKTEDPESKELSQLVDQLIEWIERNKEQKEPESQTDQLSRSALVIGLYGGRGTGKTSVLYTLFERLKERGTMVVPAIDPSDTAKGRSHHDALFRPAETRDGDELIFLLLHHLVNCCYPRDNANKIKAAARSIRQSENYRRHPDLYLKYALEISASKEDLAERTAEVRKNIAEGTEEIRKEFFQIVDYLCQGPGECSRRPLLLLIDDIDLKPKCSLELLEHLHLFMNDKDVVVLIAADKDLLLDSIAKQVDPPHLASALLAKYVPYEWHLPVPSESKRFELLWERWGELPNWWPKEESLRIYGRNDKGESYGTSAGDYARQKLAAILPDTYRSLKAMHNRCLSLREELGCNPEGRVELPPNLHSLALELGIAPIFLPALLSAVIAFEVRFPRAGLLRLSLERPERMVESLLDSLPAAERESKLGDFLERLRNVADDGAPLALFRHLQELDDEDPGKDKWSPLDRLGGARNEIREVAERHLQELANLWQSFTEAGRVTKSQRRFLAVSHKNDALDMGRPIWMGNFALDEIWHLDVRDHAADLVRARMELAEALNQRSIRSFSGELQLHAKISLALMLWLGWELRYLRNIVAWNYRTTGSTEFRGPTQRLEPRGTYQRMSVESTHPDAEGSAEAIVLIDVLGRSKPEQLDSFFDADGEPVSIPQRWRLFSEGDEIGPDDLVPLLEDAIELIERLRQDGVDRFHLGFVGPDVVAFFLGQQLNARGFFLLYEWSQERNRYEYMFGLQEPPHP